MSRLISVAFHIQNVALRSILNLSVANHIYIRSILIYVAHHIAPRSIQKAFSCKSHIHELNINLCYITHSNDVNIYIGCISHTPDVNIIKVFCCITQSSEVNNMQLLTSMRYT